MELPVSDERKRRTSSSYKLETKHLTCKITNTQYGHLNWPSFCSSYIPNRPFRYILQDVNCEAMPGEITAIAGPSGAGKTTLLEVLAGKVSAGKFSGQVLINRSPIEPKWFKRISGYVTQDDALFPNLTVHETLMYSALLRLQGGRREALGRVKVLLKELGLDQVAGSRVGEGSNSGISGGERRRVSIGVELVHDPSVVLIDEPTSGLDSSSALQVMALLKSMAMKQAKTIVVTIHQPGFRILELVNRIILLSNGVLIHNGSLQLLEEKLKFSRYRVPPRINVLEFSIDVIGGLVKGYEGIQEESNHGVISFQDNNKLSYPNSRIEEVAILGQRFCKNVFRTKQLFATRVIQALVAGLLLGTIFIDVGSDKKHVNLQTRIGFFAFTLTFLLSSTTEGLPIFLQERGILERETSRGAYRVSSYVIANTLVFLPFLLLICLLYTSSVYWMIGLRGDISAFLYFNLVVWMVLLMSNSFTACFSALVPNFIMGTSVIAGLMGSFFLFSGYFVSKDNLPDYWIFMHYLSLFKYPFECFMVNEYGGVEGRRRCVDSDEITGGCKLYGDGFLRQQGLEETQKWSNLVVMLGFIIGYRFLCLLILWIRCYRNRK